MRKKIRRGSAIIAVFAALAAFAAGPAGAASWHGVPVAPQPDASWGGSAQNAQ